MKLCIYSAICSDKDHSLRANLSPMMPWKEQNGWTVEAHLFTNSLQKIPKSSLSGWIVHDIPEEAKNLFGRKMARYIKLHPDDLLPECDWSLWIDSKVNLKVHPAIFLQFLLKKKPRTRIFCQPALRRFKCVYDEIRHGRDACLDPDPKSFNRQIIHTHKVGVPRNWRCVQTPVLYRKYGELKFFNDLWWNELDRFTVRDQYSIISVMWQTKEPVDLFRADSLCRFTKTYGTHCYPGKVKPSRPRKPLTNGQKEIARKLLKYLSLK